MADNTHCKYLSKPCSNERSLKDDGSLHRLCVFHRTKANDSQRRWHARRRTKAPTDPYIEVVEQPQRKRQRTDETKHKPKRVRSKKAVDSEPLPIKLEPVVGSPVVVDDPSVAEPPPLPDHELERLWDFVTELDDFLIESACKPYEVPMLSDNSLVFRL